MQKDWNDTAREKPKYSEKILSLRHIFHHKSHIDWTRIETEPSRFEIVDNFKRDIYLNYI